MQLLVFNKQHKTDIILFIIIVTCSQVSQEKKCNKKRLKKDCLATSVPVYYSYTPIQHTHNIVKGQNIQTNGKIVIILKLKQNGFNIHVQRCKQN